MCEKATAFQEFSFILKYCPLISAFDARSLSSISYERKKIPQTI